jgi:hypothetical protein
MASVQGMNEDHFAAKARIVMGFDGPVLLIDALYVVEVYDSAIVFVVLRSNAFPSLLFHNDGRV